MSTSASMPSAQPPFPQEQDRAPLSRRTFMAAAAVTAAGSALALPGQASAEPGGHHGANRVEVTWSSESTAPGFAPKSATWYTDPATGLAAVAHKLSRQGDLVLTASGKDFGTVINVDPAKTYQRMLGVGVSMEDSTVHNLSLMSKGARTKALRALFDPHHGAGFDLTRICFGTSDFTHGEFYTYDDGPADPTLSRFSIQRDIDNHIIATLKEALRINPELTICGTAWTAPAWMKDNNSLIDGHLLDEHVPTLARYYRKVVQAYAAQGIHIHAVTPQNEPGWPAGHYPSMLVSAQQAKRFVEELRKEFDAHGITTRIWAWDWNFGDTGTYLGDMFGSRDAGYTDTYRDTDGIAWHDYSGDPRTMSLMKTSYPDLDMVLTERMLWGTDGADRIARYLRSWSTGYISWVTLLDQNRATQNFGVPDPTPFVQSLDDRDVYWALPEYYFFAQFSKFIHRGAHRVFSDYGNTGTVTTVAYRNPDGTIATVVVNGTATAQDFTLRSGRRQLTHTLPAKTVGTYVWTQPGSRGTTTDAYAAIQAEAYDDASGVAVEVTGDTGGGEDIGSVGDGDWVEYGKVAFGGTAATQVRVRLASGAADGTGGRIDVRLNSRSAEPVGSIAVTGTGGWQTWATKSTAISGVTGTHTVYLTFASDQPDDFVNVNWFAFDH